jgi:tether containing UBX domain for GLUT4
MRLLLDQTPPKRDFKVSDPSVRDLTLAELSLAPSSVLLVRFEDESLNGAHAFLRIGRFLSPYE